MTDVLYVKSVAAIKPSTYYAKDGVYYVEFSVIGNLPLTLTSDQVSEICQRAITFMEFTSHKTVVQIRETGVSVQFISDGGHNEYKCVAKIKCFLL